MIPSPYLSGVFDSILKDGYNFTASLETNRGCPFACHARGKSPILL